MKDTNPPRWEWVPPTAGPHQYQAVQLADGTAIVARYGAAVQRLLCRWLPYPAPRPGGMWEWGSEATDGTVLWHGKVPLLHVAHARAEQWLRAQRGTGVVG